MAALPARLACPSLLPSTSPKSRPSFSTTLACTNGALPGMSMVAGNQPAKNPKNAIEQLESMLCHDSCVAQEKIEKPTGVPRQGRAIHGKPMCSQCETKGLVVCATCSGSGLYVDSILESQGIIVKVRCLGCGGSGSILCSRCGGRGHT